MREGAIFIRGFSICVAVLCLADAAHKKSNQLARSFFGAFFDEARYHDVNLIFACPNQQRETPFLSNSANIIAAE